MKISKAVLAVLLCAAVSPAISNAKPRDAKSLDTHIVAPTGHPKNPLMWLFRHRIGHAPKHKR